MMKPGILSEERKERIILELGLQCGYNSLSDEQKSIEETRALEEAQRDDTFQKTLKAVVVWLRVNSYKQFQTDVDLHLNYQDWEKFQQLAELDIWTEKNGYIVEEA